MIELNGLTFFRSFFSSLWNFLISAYVPCTNIPFAALIIGPFALSILFISLDKLLGFHAPGLFSTGHNVLTKASSDTIGSKKFNKEVLK